MARPPLYHEARWLFEQARYLRGYPVGHVERVRFFDRKAGFFARVGMLSSSERAQAQAMRERAQST